MLLVSIPKPCHENWDAMLPNEKGAFCNACAKTVVDFTGMSDEEVTQYFLQHRQQKTCGRFNQEQLTPPEIDLPALFSSHVAYWKKFLAVVFIAFGSLMTGCSGGRTLGIPVKMGELKTPPSPLRIDTTIKMLGDTTIVPLDTSTQKVQKDSACHALVGKIFVPTPPVKKPSKTQKP